MRLLLDTHAFLWWLAGDEALSANARNSISDERNDVFVSAASAWEIATKHRIGKLPAAGAFVADLEATIASQGFIGLAISMGHGRTAGGLPGPHRDPFDRMLVAQAMIEGLVIVSNEKAFDAYGAKRLW